MREDVVKTALRPHCARRFEFGSGQVVNAAGVTSQQQDVLIYDSLVGAPFIDLGRNGVHSIEHVHAALQVKTSVSAADVPAIVDNLVSVKRLMPDPPFEAQVAPGFTSSSDSMPYTGLIAFQGPADPTDVAEAWVRAAAPLPPKLRPNAAYFVEPKYTIGWARDHTLIAEPSDPPRGFVIRGRDQAVVTFYTVLNDRLNNYAPPRALLEGYIRTAWPEMKARYMNWVRGPSGPEIRDDPEG
jgi:hypothetical protein